MRVLLVSMPMASLHHPAIGLALLKGVLNKIGIATDVRHFYLDFAEHVGIETYEALNDDRYFLALVGEWIFKPAVHEVNAADDIAYFSRVLMKEYKDFLNADRLIRIMDARKKVCAFIDQCVQGVDWARYEVIGFSTSFQQNMASLALAKRVKQEFPEKLIVFGGANCEGEMGEELHRRYKFIDAAVGGEAEITFPDLVDRFDTGRELTGLSGVTVRVNGVTIPAGRPSQMIEQLDNLPALNYDDFFSDRTRAAKVSASYQAVPLYETARGCWWGQKHHCTFCGLNALGMSYRSKSQERAYDELCDLAERYGREILLVDNILDHHYFETFLPRLAATTPPILMHYEVKANLRSDQLELLARAGVRKVQPGIESFSTNILRLMRKGTTQLRNIQTLKLAAEAGVYVEWSHLYGFPGETNTDYEKIVQLVPYLTHLSPPIGINRVRADRFSPYFNSPGDFEIELMPLPAYAHIYPYDADSLGRLAYHFDISSDRLKMLEADYEQLRISLQQWSDHASAAKLSIEKLPFDEARVVDARVGTESRVHMLSRCASACLAATSEIKGLQRVREEVVRVYDDGQVTDAIDQLLDLKLLVREQDEILSLPLRQPGFARAPLKQEIRTSLELSYFYGRSSKGSRGVVA